MAVYGTKLLDLFSREFGPAEDTGTPVETTPAAAGAESLTSSEIAQLQSQLALQNYLTDLRQNPATMQPEGLLVGFDKAQAGEAQRARLAGQSHPYNGPTLQDLQRLEMAQQQALADLYAASRP